MGYAMDWMIDFISVGDGDAIIIWGRNPNDADYVFFLDGGNTGDGKKVLEHYNTFIKPHLQTNRAIGFINSHPHEDHINGLIEIIEALGSELSFAIYNDPVDCITQEHKEKIRKAFLNHEDNDITHLYKTFEEIEKLNDLCTKFNIRNRYKAYTNLTFFDGAFKILSPSEDFYVNLVQYFSDVDFLKTVDYSRKPPPLINEIDENLRACVIVDEINDASPENLTSTVIQLIDTNKKKYILTADAGVDAFEYMNSDFDPSNTRLVQLPHHGSRRNINSKWISRFNPNYFIASAVGNTKHPRKAVVNCIKRNLPSCSVYSTHISGTLCCTSNTTIFPMRNWGQALPL